MIMSLVEFLSQPFWHTLGLTLVHFAWQGFVVAVGVGALVHGLGLRHGNAGYTAYLLGFAAIIACPILTFTVVHTASIAEPKGVTEVAAIRVEDQAAYLPLPAREYASETSLSGFTMTSSSLKADPMPLRQRLSDRMHLSLPWILITWLFGVTVMSLRLLMGCMGVQRWRQDLEPLPDGLAQRIAPLARRFGMKDFAAVFVTQSDIQAMAVGYLRPIVILPATMVTRMPPEMLEAVIAHELAHIRRLDLWVILLQRMVEALLFYHPAVWWLSNRIRNEREFCCDELAVEATDERVTYASTLEQVARARVEAKQWLLAAGIARSDLSVLGRVRHILGLEPSQRHCPFWLAGVMTLLMLGSLAIPVVIAAAGQKEAVPSAQFIPVIPENQTYRYGPQRRTPEEMARIGPKFIAGLVIDEDASPIAEVSVEACGQWATKTDGKIKWKFLGTRPDLANTVTDDQGRFAIELPEDGLYNLRFVSENHAAIIAYDVPQDTYDLNVTLPEGATLRGRIMRSEDGREEPFSFAKVKIRQRDRNAYYYLGTGRDLETMTDSQGRFEFRHLRTKQRTPETQNSQQWQYYPRYWTFAYEESMQHVVFPGDLNTAVTDIVLSNDGIRVHARFTGPWSESEDSAQGPRLPIMSSRGIN